MQSPGKNIGLNRGTRMLEQSYPGSWLDSGNLFHLSRPCFSQLKKKRKKKKKGKYWQNILQDCPILRPSENWGLFNRRNELSVRLSNTNCGKTLGKVVFTIIIILLHYIIILCVQSGEAWWVGRSKVNFQEYTNSFCSMGLGDWTHASGFGGK